MSIATGRPGHCAPGAPVTRPLRPGFQDDVERSLGGAAELPEAALLHDDLAQPRFTGLRAERRPALGQGDRDAHQRGSPVIHPADGIEVVLEAIARERLDDHAMTVGLERLPSVAGGSGRIGHVVQAVEEGHEVELPFAVAGGIGYLEAGVADSRLRRPAAGGLDGGGVIVDPDELRRWERPSP